MDAAYVLHTRPWRETSLIAELFTPTHGRIGVVARGARRARRGAASSLQPFVRLRCDWRGRGELRTLGTAEAERMLWLTGDALYAGLYVNELLMRLLQREDAHPTLFALYARTLELLAAGRPLEPVLRRFEFGLLDDLGYGFPMDVDADGLPLQPQADYRLDPDAGLVRVAASVADGGQRGAVRFSGADLLAVAALDAAWQATGAELPAELSPEARRTAKLLARVALAPHLGSKPLRSRALFTGAGRGAATAQAQAEAEAEAGVDDAAAGDAAPGTVREDALRDPRDERD
ncbi:MAG TPA: DNA repair protein RecO [Pseudomonadales bacterium]|nr:DNA repair protein RecO [Pseudomonadales bacterium]